MQHVYNKNFWRNKFIKEFGTDLDKYTNELYRNLPKFTNKISKWINL
jgi:hypothetical protein